MAYNNRSTKSKDNTKPFLIAGLVILVLLIIAFILLVFRSCAVMDSPDPDNPNNLIFDDGAVVGGWDEADIDAIISGLNDKVEEGMINISMNTSPVFKDGTSEGNLMIVNEGVNHYPQIVEITRNDTGELIYKSGGIPVGSKIETAKLSVDLPAGIYECTAIFHSVDPDTGVSLGCAGAVITITIQQ